MESGIAFTVAVVLLGLVSSPLTQLVKKHLGNPEGQAASFIFYGVSFVIALVATLVTTGFAFDISSPETFVPQLVSAFTATITLGTMVYNRFKRDMKALETPAV